MAKKASPRRRTRIAARVTLKPRQTEGPGKASRCRGVAVEPFARAYVTQQIRT